MTRYAAFLRGINVGGHRRIAMADLRDLFHGLGHADAQTHLQSGNVAFTGPDDDPARVAAGIEAAITRDLGLSVGVMLRTGDELAHVVAGNPFRDREPDPRKLHVAFLAAVPDTERVAAFEVPPGETAGFAFDGRDVHLHYPDGYGRTRLNHAYLERRLGVAATARNWRTVTALRDLTGG